MAAETKEITAAMRALSALGDRVVLGAPLGELTTYRVGGHAAVLVSPRSASKTWRLSPRP